MRSPLTACLFAAVLLAMASPGAAARMYQWVDPTTRTVQLSGTPPPWYRSEKPGPRVFVFEHGRLMDDTSVTVSEAGRLVLRAQAFGAATEAVPQPVGPPAAVAEPVPPAPPATPAAATAAPTLTEAQIAEFKALLEVWDREQLERAKSALEAP